METGSQTRAAGHSYGGHRGEAASTGSHCSLRDHLQVLSVQLPSHRWDHSSSPVLPLHTIKCQDDRGTVLTRT